MRIPSPAPEFLLASPWLFHLDRNWPRTEEYQSYVRGIAPQVEYHVWEDATHMLLMELPDRVNRLVEKFVAKVGSP